MNKNRHILVRGGGVDDPSAFWAYTFSLTQKTNPCVLYLGQAGGEDPYWAMRTFKRVIALGGYPESLSFFAPMPSDLKAYVGAFDIVFVGGGNTRSMLALWREWGMDEALKAAYENGVVMTGMSAGGLCWFESGTTDSWAGPLRAIKNGLGFLPFSHCPHYDGEKQRRPTYTGMVQSGELPSGYAIDDAAALHFTNEVPTKALSLKEASQVYKVTPQGEEPLPCDIIK